MIAILISLRYRTQGTSPDEHVVANTRMSSDCSDTFQSLEWALRSRSGYV